MKNVDEFYKEFCDSKALREELKNATDKVLDSFLKKHNCDADAQEFIEFAKSHFEGAISDDSAASVAGGKADNPHLLAKVFFVV